MLVKKIICATCGINYGVNYGNNWEKDKCGACGGRLIEIEVETDYCEED